MLDYLKDSFTTADDRAEALLAEVCTHIDAIHGVQGVAQYEFYVDELPTGVHGRHFQGLEVVVSSKTPYQILATIHELGHAIDGVFLNSAQGFGTPAVPDLRYGSDLAEEDGTSLLGDWLRAVRASQYWQSLNSALSEASASPAQKEEIMKLLNVRECWARSYEMFIAYRKSNSYIGRQMDHEVSLSVKIGGITVNNYWQGNDFRNVEVCIEEVFRRIQWLI